MCASEGPSCSHFDFMILGFLTIGDASTSQAAKGRILLPIPPFEERRSLLRISRHQFRRHYLQESVVLPAFIQDILYGLPASPPVGLDWAVFRCSIRDLRCCPSLRPTMIINLLVLVLQLDGEIEVNDFQAEGPFIDNEIVRFDVPVGDEELVEVREAFDEPRTELEGIIANHITIETETEHKWCQLWKNEPCCRRCVE